MTTPTANSLAKWIGLSLGLCLAAFAVVSWRIPASEATLGADVKLVSSPPGELELSEDGALASGRALLPGRGSASGDFEVRNLTGGKVSVQLRALPSNDDLDDLMRLELRSGGRVLADGTLGELRSWGSPSLEIDRAQDAKIEARLWLPSDADRGYEGRITDVTLELRARPTGRAP